MSNDKQPEELKFFKSRKLFCEQPAYCLNCGKPFMTNFQFYKGTVCSEVCGKEMQWKETLYIMGKEYYTKPVKDEK